MSKKDFIALADAIRHHNHYCVDVERFTEFQIGVLADFCREQNSNFKTERWLDYIAGKCGKNGGRVAA